MFLIYGTKNCDYCELAKKLLTVHDKEFTFIDVDAGPAVKAAFFQKFPNVNRVPQIVDGDRPRDMKHIGGYNELVEYLKRLPSDHWSLR